MGEIKKLDLSEYLDSPEKNVDKVVPTKFKIKKLDLDGYFNTPDEVEEHKVSIPDKSTISSTVPKSSRECIGTSKKYTLAGEMPAMMMVGKYDDIDGRQHIYCYILYEKNIYKVKSVGRPKVGRVCFSEEIYIGMDKVTRYYQAVFQQRVEGTNRRELVPIVKKLEAAWRKQNE